MDGWKSWKRSESWFLSAWYQRVRESYVAAWFFGVFQNNRTMSTSTAPGGGGGGGVGGALSLMGCVREASPPPQNHHPHHHYHHHHHHHQQQQQQQHRAFGLGEFPAVQHSIDPVPKEPKKRRFHPLRGLRKIFRRKSRGAADARLVSNSGDRDAELAHLPREEITMRHPAGRPEEVRSRSASELLTDACDRESVFLRRGGVQDNFVKLRGGAGKLSVSHDSVFPGEVPHTRPLSSLASLTTLERRQTRKSNEIIEHKEYNHHAAQRHRISLRVLEQIKTVIENRNQLASATSTETASIAHNRFAVFDKHGERSSAEECQQAKITRSTKDTVDRTVLVAKEDLPQLESVSLNHTAAHHRISVRPKNRRPPRRTVPTTTSSDVGFSNSSSIPPTIVEDTLDSLEQQKQEQQKQEQQLSQSTTNNGSLSPTEPPSKTVGVIRKSSSRLSRNSDIFEELESRLPRKTSATSLSPDSLDVTTMSQSSAEIATTEEQQQPEIKWITRKPSNRISKGSDVFEELEAKLPRRRSSSNRLSKSPDSLDSAPGCWFSKSTDEAFDKLVEYDEIAKPVASVRRPLLNPISKSTDRVSKSSDSLEAIEPLVSDDSIERRRSFDFRVHKSSKLISKSSENFDVLEQSTCIETEIGQELQKRSSVSDINLSRRRLSKSISKSSESFERIDMSDMKDDVDVEVLLEDDAPKAGGRRTKRMSSESSDNLDGEDRLENRRVRRMPKRMPSTSIVDMIISGDDHERERRPTPTRKPSRLQKSSESSELGSTDTLDSERRNKSSESTETLDSLEKDLEQDRKDEEITDSVDKREKNDSWSSRNVAITDSDQASMGDDTEDSKSLISADNKYYWRQSSEPASKENLGIQQLLAITIMTRMADNGNNQRGSYPKKRQQMSTSQPSSPVAKQEDTKMLFDNLLVNSKNDEDLQNMLNGNISEVSTDTKSFKEKLIMFEKLGK
ncbi:J domain-containing protein DDB_G0295729-like isoform X2 [Cataglyphis hispanica]|uniref:J domain-containing protein DDB_G0295729-like isoform X2 n=1 Tax=Cataglyphis hispanica TaxID=1086592 RepID=UPI00217FD77B|nr:J domain-containing protein DDB_G0295729-like isoform X2 [Cataglyphis hispanica]